MMTATTKMTAAVAKLLVAVRDGAAHYGNATTYKAALAAGWLVYEDTYTRMPNGEYGRGYVLTDAGKAALAAKFAVKSAAPHRGDCKCPKCAVAHVGCRRLNCPICG